MKNIKNIILGMALLLGVTATIEANVAPVVQLDCAERFTDCDETATFYGERNNMSYLEEYQLFAWCMTTGGC